MLYPNLVKLIQLSILSVVIAGLVTACHRDDHIQSYTAPKENPAPSSPATPSMTDATAPAVPVNSAPIHWNTPAGWQELSPTSVRIGNFLIPGAGEKKAEVSITSFPGDVGGPLANVNRWRREDDLGEITDADLNPLPVTVDSIDGKLYDITGASLRTTVAVISHDGSSWFFKMHGDKETVASAQPAYQEFLKSIHFGAAAVSQAPAVAPTAPVAAEPAATPAAGPKFSPPANWTETVAGPMVEKSYSISADGGQGAAVSISVLGPVAGGVLANVNRWRGQIALPAIEEAALPSNTESVDVLGGKATLVDFTGADKSGQPSRLVAAIVPRGDATWFFKLTGPVGVVGGEKAAFVIFVQSVQY